MVGGEIKLLLPMQHVVLTRVGEDTRRDKDGWTQ